MCDEPYFFCWGWDGPYCYDGEWYQDCWWEEGGGGGCYDCGGGSTPGTAIRVTVTVAEIREDKIEVNLEGTTSTGNLVVRIKGTERDWVVNDDTRGPGTHRFDFQPFSLPLQEYSKVEATWTVGSNTAAGEKPVNFRAMGVHNGTSYSTPTESQCSGERDWDGDYEDPYYSCNFHDDVSKRIFADEVYENGSGRNQTLGPVQIPWRCPQRSERGRYRLVDQINGAWGQPVNDSTVAVPDNHPYLKGEETPTIVVYRGAERHTKTVTDRCPDCAAGPFWLDHYSSSPGCRKRSVPSFGDGPVFHLR